MKLVLDAVFGAKMFQNEIVWKRSSAHNDSKKMGIVHDIIFYVSKSDKATRNRVFQIYDEHYLSTHYQKKTETGRRFEDGPLTAEGLSGGGYSYTWKGINKLYAVPLKQ